MDEKFLQWVFNIGTALVGWFATTTWAAQKKTVDDLVALRLHVAENYVTKATHNDLAEGLFRKLDRIEERVSAIAENRKPRHMNTNDS